MEFRNVIFAIALSFAVLFGWSVIFETPRIEEQKKLQQSETNLKSENNESSTPSVNVEKNISQNISREDAIKSVDRIILENESIKGSISLKGALIDDITFKKYNENINSNKKVTYLNPEKTKEGYFIETGWAANNIEKISLPNKDSTWKVKGNRKLSSTNPVVIEWNNKSGLIFRKKIELDDKFLFRITQEIHNKFSLRASVTAALFFDNVRIPSSNVLPGIVGMKGPLSCLSQARYGISWGVIGAAQACLEEALNYLNERVLFNKPVSHTQTIQIRLADMSRRITTAQLLSYKLGKLKDAGKLTPSQISVAKWNNCRMALDVARDARDILGGSGISAEYVPIRHMLNLESVITYEGTETVHQLVVGKELTGMNAF